MANPMMAQLMQALQSQQQAAAPVDYSQMSDLELSRRSINDANAAAAMQQRTRSRSMQGAQAAPAGPLPSTTPGLALAPTMTNQGSAMSMLDRFGEFAEPGQEPIQREGVPADDGGMNDIISALGSMRGKFGKGSPGGAKLGDFFSGISPGVNTGGQNFDFGFEEAGGAGGLMSGIGNDTMGGPAGGQTDPGMPIPQGGTGGMGPAFEAAMGFFGGGDSTGGQPGGMQRPSGPPGESPFGFLADQWNAATDPGRVPQGPMAQRGGGPPPTGMVGAAGLDTVGQQVPRAAMPGTTPVPSGPEGGPIASVDIPPSMVAPRGGSAAAPMGGAAQVADVGGAALPSPGQRMLATEAGPNAGGPESMEQRLARELMAGGTTSTQDPNFKIGRPAPEKSFLEGLGLNSKDLLQFGLAMAASSGPEGIRGRSIGESIGLAGLRTTKIARRREEKRYQRETAKATARAEQGRHEDKMDLGKGKITATYALARENIRVKESIENVKRKLDLMKLDAMRANTQVSKGNLARATATARGKELIKMKELFLPEKEEEIAEARIHAAYDGVLREQGLPVPYRGAGKANVLESARKALAAGVDREKVEKRLKELGGDPSKL